MFRPCFGPSRKSKHAHGRRSRPAAPGGGRRPPIIGVASVARPSDRLLLPPTTVSAAASTAPHPTARAPRPLRTRARAGQQICGVAPPSAAPLRPCSLVQPPPPPPAAQSSRACSGLALPPRIMATGCRCNRRPTRAQMLLIAVAVADSSGEQRQRQRPRAAAAAAVRLHPCHHRRHRRRQ
jgi:hypothetical protein